MTIEEMSEDYKLMLDTFSQQEEEKKITTQTQDGDESVFSKCERLGKQKKWVQLTQSDMYHNFRSKAGNLVKIKDFIKEEVDNARFKAGKYPFFGARYLWTKNDTFPWTDKATGQPMKKCPSGIGNDAIFRAMVRNNEVDKYLSQVDYSQALADEYEILENNDFKEV